jgi:hypothetical protein
MRKFMPLAVELDVASAIRGIRSISSSMYRFAK